MSGARREEEGEKRRPGGSKAAVGRVPVRSASRPWEDAGRDLIELAFASRNTGGGAKSVSSGSI